jgi:hypothetical protein
MNASPSSSSIPVPVNAKVKDSTTSSEKMSGDQRTVVAGNSSFYVKLNVGGSLYYTTIGTLTKKDNMLSAMFSGRLEVLTDSDGELRETESVRRKRECWSMDYGHEMPSALWSDLCVVGCILTRFFQKNSSFDPFQS